MVTAVRTAAGNLKVILWQTNSTGVVTRLGDSNGFAGASSLPTLVEPLGARVLTAVRAATSSLKLITWST